MSTATLKRELAVLRSSLAALKPSQSATLEDPIAWAEQIAGGFSLDPWQREVLLSAAPRLLLNATRQSGKSTAAALKAAWTVLLTERGRSARGSIIARAAIRSA